MKTPDYMNYTRYKKKKNTTSRKSLLIFVTTFFVTLLFLTIIARGLSPNVDVTIGEETDVEPKETGLGVKRFIDNRLKMIQMEDRDALSAQKIEDKKTKDFDDESFDSFSRELDEKVNLPSKKDSTIEEEALTDRSISPPRPKPVKDLLAPFESPKMSKVIVGHYNTVEQAKVAQGILLDAGFSITPFIKDMGGSYTLQVGSYSSRSKADSVANELLRNNFPARVIQE